MRTRRSLPRLLLPWLAVGALALAVTDRVPADSGLRPIRSQVLRGAVERVRDGDTIEVEGFAVRLQGVAAPELDEPLGAESREALVRLVAGRSVVCVPDGTRTRGRIVAVCSVDGRDLGAALVAAGLARDCPRYSNGRYVALEQAAAARGSPIQRSYPLPSYCLTRQQR